ncbi:ATP-binding protein [Halobellus salinisoli]|uniref:ATP-binding protein n=1 Tax=Halobellus salinisoli TaxID=3108500 RepID=UPI0030090268
MPWIREDEFYAVLQAVDDGVQSVHISGQPGVGKSTFLEELEEELLEWYRTRVLYVREGNTPTTLSQDLLIEARDAVGTLSALINKATGMSVGISPASAGVSTDDRARHLRKLASLSESVNEYKRLIFFVDDVHKLDEPEVTRDFLRELSSTLGENVHLITAGRLSFDDADYTVHLETFSREETANYFQEEHPDVDNETIDGVYEKLDGHPYYLGLLREAAGDDGTFEIPKEDTRDFIESAYLDSMSEAEEEFIRKTAGLAELDEDICSAVLDDVSRTQARRTLDSLSTKAVVQELGRSEDTGDRVFKVHDLFQEFLSGRVSVPSSNELLNWLVGCMMILTDPLMKRLTFVLTDGSTLIGHQGGKSLFVHAPAIAHGNQTKSWAVEQGATDHFLLASEPAHNPTMWTSIRHRGVVGVSPNMTA